MIPDSNDINFLGNFSGEYALHCTVETGGGDYAELPHSMKNSAQAVLLGFKTS